MAKNRKEREVPSCLFNMVGRSSRCTGYHFEDFALSVFDAHVAAGDADGFCDRMTGRQGPAGLDS